MSAARSSSIGALQMVGQPRLVIIGRPVYGRAGCSTMYTRQMIRLLSGAAFLLAALCASVSLSAHLTVVKTQPAADSTVNASPERLAVWFSQAPSSRLSRLELRGPNGDDVIELEKATVNAEDRSVSVAVPRPLAAGTYTVGWRTAGDDGHVMRGTFSFIVQPAH